MESQSTRSGQLRSVDGDKRTYLGDIARDPGGTKAAQQGQKAASDYLARTQNSSRLNLGPRDYVGIAGATALTLAVCFGDCREALEDLYRQIF